MQLNAYIVLKADIVLLSLPQNELLRLWLTSSRFQDSRARCVSLYTEGSS